MSAAKYPRDLLARTAAVSTSLVDLMRRLDSPMDARTMRYLRLRLEHYGVGISHFADESLPARDRRSYSRELLEDAAAHTYSIREMVEYLGYPPSDSPYGLISSKLQRFGIDTSHFRKGRKHGPPVLPREPLATVVARSSSLAGVLRGLGQKESGAARARVGRSLEAHGIPTDHFTGQGHARGTVSPHRGSAEETLRRRAPGSPRTRTVKLRRALDDLTVPHVCAECGIGESWQGKRLVLEIDHINGDRLDDRRENLRYLCPSCHSQTGTFANRSPSLRGTK
ncbi:HNH endonuclease signature motif containing protein [Streptomyces sp. NBC_00388]|uniref:HNH endonuclease signature motif containing protein n=1 Tax=Streptomyces sp. NBC_00388 TaxID=2975735 RepID=UPI002E1E0A03